jgi:hypothetical protein
VISIIYFIAHPFCETHKGSKSPKLFFTGAFTIILAVFTILKMTLIYYTSYDIFLIIYFVIFAIATGFGKIKNPRFLGKMIWKGKHIMCALLFALIISMIGLFLRGDQMIYWGIAIHTLIFFERGLWTKKQDNLFLAISLIIGVLFQLSYHFS